jgi:hypothetical protein
MDREQLLEKARKGLLTDDEVKRMSMEDYAVVRGILLKQVRDESQRESPLWQQWDTEGEVERTCPWCGLLCESVEALAEHEEECE